MADNQFTNRKRAIARMRAIPAAVRIAVRDQMNVERVGLEEAIRAAVPVDQGDLKASVRSYDGSNGERIRGVIVEGETSDPSQKRKARAVEFGRSDMAAQPHFFPTYRGRKKKIASRLMKAARDAIKRVLS